MSNGGNPTACAAALATMDSIEADGLVARAASIESLMKERLDRLQADGDRIGDVLLNKALDVLQETLAEITRSDLSGLTLTLPTRRPLP